MTLNVTPATVFHSVTGWPNWYMANWIQADTYVIFPRSNMEPTSKQRRLTSFFTKTDNKNTSVETVRQSSPQSPQSEIAVHNPKRKLL